MDELPVEATYQTCDDGCVQAHACNDQQDHDHKDNCSPFCVCSCCATPAYFFVSGLQAIKAPIPERARLHTRLYIGEITEIALPIWQPPQLNA